MQTGSIQSFVGESRSSGLRQAAIVPSHLGNGNA